MINGSFMDYYCSFVTQSKCLIIKVSLSAILVNFVNNIVVTKVLLSDRELEDNGLLVHCDIP